MTAPDSNPPNAPSGLNIGVILAVSALIATGLWFLFGSGGRTPTADERAAAPAAAVVADTKEFSPAQRSAIESIVKAYLLENPEILFEVQSALESKMMAEEAERTKSLVAEHAKDIFRAPGAPVAGNPDGDITVVEFFDYNCGYCKRGFTELAKLIDSDDRVRVVFKEFPILSEESRQAARIALAAGLQGKYWEVHSDLITTRGVVNEAVGLRVAEKHGLDMEKLKADLTSPAVEGELTRVKELAGKLSINGTPHFLIGDRAIGGAPENLLEVLATHVAELRKAGCSYC